MWTDFSELISEKYNLYWLGFPDAPLAMSIDLRLKSGVLLECDVI